MNSPFGSSNQGGFRQQPQQQSWGGEQGFGGGQGFGGFQPQQQSFGGFGGGAGFGGYGGGYGGGFNPFQGGFGGFSLFQGGYGGGFQPQFNPFQGGYGGFGFNPMFGGIGGLGFNPMMGPQFGMPMQGFNRVEDRPTPQQSLLRPDGRGGFFDPSEQRMRSAESIAQNPSSSQNFGAPLYGGIGGLGFNPMMGPQFGMPMGQRAQLLQDQRQFGYGQDMTHMQPKEDLSFEAFKASQPKRDPNDITQYMTMQRPSQEQQYRSWLNSKVTPDGNRQSMLGERPKQSISQSDVDSIYNRYLENSRPNAQTSAQLAAAQDAQMRAVMGI